MRDSKILLHVGCGFKNKSNTTKGFSDHIWRELRLDVNPQVNPDVVGSMTDMGAVKANSVDAIFSSHNLEHLYAHEVVLAINEFKRVLKPNGILVLTCPDLQSICAMVAEGKLTESAYNSPAGPIAPIDMIYGHRRSIQSGDVFMAHRCGFTEKVLVGTFRESGFHSVISARREHPFYDLWMIATLDDRSQEEMVGLVENHFPLRSPVVVNPGFSA